MKRLVPNVGMVTFIVMTMVCAASAKGQAQTPKGPQPVAINTEADEDNPHPVPMKGQPGSYRLYFSRSQAGVAEPKIDLYASTWSKTKREWANTELVGPQVQTKGNETSCFVTPYGSYPQTIWYSSTKEPRNGKQDIFGAVRDLPPTAPGEHRVFSGVRALTTIDTPLDETHPWLSRDLRTIYFTKETKEGFRVAAASRKTMDGPRGFEDAAVIEEIAPGYCHPTVSPDGSVMYLHGPREGGGVGMFRCRKAGGKWGNPVPLKGVNMAESSWDGSPNLSRDGLSLYFSSDRPGGKGGRDIYAIPVSLIKD